MANNVLYRLDEFNVIRLRILQAEEKSSRLDAEISQSTARLISSPRTTDITFEHLDHQISMSLTSNDI